MEKREIPRHPKVPELSEKAVELLSELCFRPDDELKSADFLFVFGTPRFIKETAHEVEYLLSQDFTRKVVITGGKPNYEDNEMVKDSESEQILARINESKFPHVDFLLDKISRNTLENVIEGLKLVDIDKLKRVIYLYKTHDSTRGYLTLKKFLPDVELLQHTFAPNYGYEESLARDTWHRNEDYRQRVWGEFLRIQLFGGRGDISYPEGVKELVEEIARLTA